MRLRLKPYIQPFERKLALAELAALANSEPKLEASSPVGLNFTVSTRRTARFLAERLAYWESISDEKTYHTSQIQREATANIVRNGFSFHDLPKILPFGAAFPVPGRRCLRYGPHGIHEYRGKFFPQLVRSLVNIAQLNRSDIVLDPMCGSGTTIVESLLSGHHCLGLDLNPLSVFIADTKAQILFATPKSILTAYDQNRRQLLGAKRSSRNGTLEHFERLSQADQIYLRRWFSDKALVELDRIVLSIKMIRPGPVRDLFLLSLSNILRRVSWQKTDDLRVRKDLKKTVHIGPIALYIQEIERTVRTLVPFLYQNGDIKRSSFCVEQGDAKKLPHLFGRHMGRISAVITSPPYATALPYIDTDRLSLCFLGLLTRNKHRETDSQMIGNREITDRTRKQLWDTFQASKASLPPSIRSLVTTLAEVNGSDDVGFRRKNLPSLLAKYFLDMKEVLTLVHLGLKPGAPAYFVVGSNHTVAGGRRVDIDTPKLLSDIAESVGFDVAQPISMEMLVSRDIFRNNAVATESILQFRKPR
jgi:RMKL-like, methyltransferase domain